MAAQVARRPNAHHANVGITQNDHDHPKSLTTFQDSNMSKQPVGYFRSMPSIRSPPDVIIHPVSYPLSAIQLLCTRSYQQGHYHRHHRHRRPHSRRHIVIVNTVTPYDV